MSSVWRALLLSAVWFVPFRRILTRFYVCGKMFLAPFAPVHRGSTFLVRPSPTTRCGKSFKLYDGMASVACRCRRYEPICQTEINLVGEWSPMTFVGLINIEHLKNVCLTAEHFRVNVCTTPKFGQEFAERTSLERNVCVDVLRDCTH